MTWCNIWKEIKGVRNFWICILAAGFWQQTATSIGSIPPPQSEGNLNSKFMDDSLDPASQLVFYCKELIIAGDINMHINDVNIPHGQKFMDLCEARKLKQWITFSTHKSGNPLDLIMTKVLSNVKLLDIIPGPFISDHHGVHVSISYPKPKDQKDKITFRNLKKMDTDQFLRDLDWIPFCRMMVAWKVYWKFSMAMSSMP